MTQSSCSLSLSTWIQLLVAPVSIHSHIFYLRLIDQLHISTDHIPLMLTLHCGRHHYCIVNITNFRSLIQKSFVLFIVFMCNSQILIEFSLSSLCIVLIFDGASLRGYSCNTQTTACVFISLIRVILVLSRV